MQEKAIEKLQSAIGTSYLELKECLREDTVGQNHEWLEIKALRCEEQLREVLDFIRGFGSGNTLHEGIAVAAPEDVLELFHCIDSDFREQQARIRELVVYEKVPVNCRHPVSGDGPLDFAVLRRRPASARTLLALGATLASCSSQVTDLYEAALSGGLEDIVQLCLRWGSSYEAHVALFAAAQLGDAERCRQLLAIKADPARREQVTGFSVLEWAVLAPVSADVVVSLLPYADAVAIQSTLRLSAIYGRSTVLYHLMSADCDVCRRDADGWTAFDWAMSRRLCAAAAAAGSADRLCLRPALGVLSAGVASQRPDPPRRATGGRTRGKGRGGLRADPARGNGDRVTGASAAGPLSPQ